MKTTTDKAPQQSPSHFPPHHISEALKKWMDEANQEPTDPNRFLDRLPRK